MLLSPPGPGKGGGGGTQPGKETDCGPTAGEQWLSRPTGAKKKREGGGLSLYCIVG